MPVPISVHTTTTSQAPSYVPVPTPASVSYSHVQDPKVALLEQQLAQLRAEFDAFKAQQTLQNQSFDALIKSFQSPFSTAPTMHQYAPSPFGSFPQ